MKLGIIATAAVFVATVASAQELGTSMSAASVDILQMDGNAVMIGDRIGDKYLCAMSDKRAYVEIGDCKPLRISKRVGEYVEAQDKVVGLFERNDCTLTYNQLKSALANADEATRTAVAEIMADMKNSGGLVDNKAKASAVMTIGKCAK